MNPTTTAPTVTNFGFTETIRSPGLLNDSLSFYGTVNTQKNDYSKTMVILQPTSSATSPLNFNSPETSGELGTEYKFGQNTANVSYGQMLTTQDPFAYRSASLGFNHSFFSQTTTVGSNLYWMKQNQPFTYYTSQRFIDNRLRPSQLTAERAELWLEQVLTESWKTQVRALGGQRIEDRPFHYGVEWRNSYTVSDRIFTRVDIGAIKERHNRELMDDSGYYSDYWVEGQVTYEVIYDLLLTGSLGTSVEREEVPWKSVTNQVGLDSYGLKLSYKGKRWTAGVSGNMSFSNTNYKTNSFVGTFTWNI